MTPAPQSRAGAGNSRLSLGNQVTPEQEGRYSTVILIPERAGGSLGVGFFFFFPFFLFFSLLRKSGLHVLRWGTPALDWVIYSMWYE